MSAASAIKDMICDVIYKRNQLSPNQIGISKIKDLFIDNLSPRRLSAIDDINDFFDILERLDLGSINNLNGFHKIAQYLNCPELDDLLNASNEIPRHQQVAVGFNQYEYRRKNNIKPEPNAETGKKLEEEETKPSNVIPETQSSSQYPLTKHKRDILDLISTEIGKKWRNIGRELDFGEGEMDNLESRHPVNLRERIYSMLSAFCDRIASDEAAFNHLCRALENCKRIDLRKKVKEILSNK